MKEISSFPNKDTDLKPGFFEQAKEIKNIINGKKASVSASLEDAYKSQKLLNEILYNF